MFSDQTSVWLPCDDTAAEAEEQQKKRTGKNFRHIFISKTVQTRFLAPVMMMVVMMLVMRIMVTDLDTVERAGCLRVFGVSGAVKNPTLVF